MTQIEPIVEGEPAALLLEALLEIFANGRDKNGMFEFNGAIGGEAGAALIHALGRVTAELHAADIRSFLPGGARNTRTEQQRSADALIELSERVLSALASGVVKPPSSTSTGLSIQE